MADLEGGIVSSNVLDDKEIQSLETVSYSVVSSSKKGEETKQEYKEIGNPILLCTI